MISSYELRKGNCVEVENQLGYVTQILWDGIEVEILKGDEKTYSKCLNENLQPIKLTPEILLECGFHKNERFHFSDVYTNKEENFIINLLRDACEISFGSKGSFGIVANREPALHELQTCILY